MEFGKAGKTAFAKVFPASPVQISLWRQFQKSSKMAENSCCDLQMERFRLVLHSFSEGGW